MWWSLFKLSLFLSCGFQSPEWSFAVPGLGELPATVSGVTVSVESRPNNRTLFFDPGFIAELEGVYTCNDTGLGIDPEPSYRLTITAGLLITEHWGFLKHHFWWHCMVEISIHKVDTYVLITTDWYISQVLHLLMHINNINPFCVRAELGSFAMQHW